MREVFIASNFEEFAPLRRALRERINASTFARAVDLGQNRADPSSVEELSVGRVRSADLAIILIGARYGRCVAGRQLSYTHLEYRAARGDKVPVLPYFIGPQFSRGGVVENRNSSGEDPQLRALKREIMARHVVSFHSPTDPEQLADAIFERAREFFLETRSDGDAEEEDGELGEIGQLPGEDFSALYRLGRSLEDTLSRSQLEVLQRPARTAAVEQLLEARRAYGIGDRHAAIHHFRRALEYRPLAFEAGYSLARLLATSTQLKHCREASQLARRMARLAEFEKHSLGQGIALVVAARAELSQGNEDRAVELAQEAIDAAETRASIRIEGAAVYAAVGLLPPAVEQARRAFLLRPESFIRLERDPVLSQSSEFRALKLELETKIRQLVSELRQVYRNCIVLEASLRPDNHTADDDPPQDDALDPEPSLIRRVRIGKALGKGIIISLQCCAAGLLGLRDQLHLQRRRVAELEEALAHAGQSSVATLFGVCLSIAMLLIAALAWLAKFEWRWLALTLLCLSLGLALFSYLRARAGFRQQIDTARGLERQLQAGLESSAESFLRSVQDFERAAVEPLSGMFSPTVGPHRAQPGKDVRLRVDDPRAQGFELESDVLPPELGLQLVNTRPTNAGAQVFRIIRQKSGKWLASKSACYFDVTLLSRRPANASSDQLGRTPFVRQPTAEASSSEYTGAATVN